MSFVMALLAMVGAAAVITFLVMYWWDQDV